MKKRILSALLLACALVIAPVGNIFSTVATASSNVWEPQAGHGMKYVYGKINSLLPRVFGDESMTAMEALQKLHEWYSAEELQAYIQIEPAIGGVLRQLGMKLTESGTTESASSEVGQIATVQVSGAALNAASEGAAVELKVTAPAQTVDLGGAANVQVDINLTGVADSHNLIAPVQITMSVPAGLSAGNMHIRHYVNGTGAEAEIVPFVDNGDGTITFSVSSFSLFAFVEGQAPTPDDSNNGGDNDDNDDRDDSNDSNESAPSEQVKDSVPKTGDSTIPVLPFAAAGAVCAAAAFALKKKEQ